MDKRKGFTDTYGILKIAAEGNSKEKLSSSINSNSIPLSGLSDFIKRLLSSKQSSSIQSSNE